MITLIPASRHLRSASGTSGLGGSSRPTSPAKTRSCSRRSRLPFTAHQAVGKREDPQALLGHRFLGCEDLLAQPAVERTRARHPAESGCTAAERIRARPCSTAWGPPASRARWTAACGRRRRESRPAGDRRMARARCARAMSTSATSIGIAQEGFTASLPRFSEVVAQLGRQEEAPVATLRARVPGSIAAGEYSAPPRNELSDASCGSGSASRSCRCRSPWSSRAPRPTAGSG